MELPASVSTRPRVAPPRPARPQQVRRRLRDHVPRAPYRRIILGLFAAILVGSGATAAANKYRYDFLEKRVAVVEPGRLVRGAWQKPAPLRRIIEREGIKTIVTVAAVPEDDPRYIEQAEVVRDTGVKWIVVGMVGSRATMDQMAQAADLLNDPALQPVYFHCVAGHHRTSLAHAAYLIRHRGLDAAGAWDEVERYPWARPEADNSDHRLIEEFASKMGRKNH